MIAGAPSSPADAGDAAEAANRANIGTPWRAAIRAVPLGATARADAVRLLRVLRPTLDEAAAGLFLDEASATGYTVMLLEDADGAAAALAGWRILPTSRGRVLFLEDLVVDDAHRRMGAARTLLAHVADAARAARCVRVELDTGLGNTSAQALYDGAGLSRVAVHYGWTV